MGDGNDDGGEGRTAAAIELPVAPDLDTLTALRILSDGRLELIGRLLASSNNALLGTVELDGIVVPAVYKPIRGERPLWDFPDGTLAARELAAFLLSEVTPWAVVPPTVMRGGRFGRGMVQLWLHADPTVDRVAMVVDGDARLRPMAIFDVVLNNADRKIGHVLPMPDGHVFGVDHGICFHEEPHLRTVLWRWQGDRVRADEREILRELRVCLDEDLGRDLGPLLTRRERRELTRRIDDLLAVGRLPYPDPDRPAIPWPPY